MEFNKPHPLPHDSIAPLNLSQCSLCAAPSGAILLAFKQELVMQAFAALHPGNAVRFGISPLVFAAGKERLGGV
jgi:hypothetical protein